MREDGGMNEEWGWRGSGWRGGDEVMMDVWWVEGGWRWWRRTDGRGLAGHQNEDQ